MLEPTILAFASQTLGCLKVIIGSVQDFTILFNILILVKYGSLEKGKTYPSAIALENRNCRHSNSVFVRVFD